MTRYSKGARCERELLSDLHSRGYSVMRSAGSGINTLSPDIIAMKSGKRLAFECKAWDSGNLSMENERFRGLLEWQSNTGMETYVAWRMSNAGWYFIKLEEMKVNEKTTTVSKRQVLEANRRLEAIIL
ncbi:MAG: Holliday junction resolvase Hjc [Candidatus Micrarchaeaceae archaeon]